MADIAATPFQQQVLALPEEVDVLLSGGRGGGKTYCVALEILRRTEKWPGKTRTLVLRLSSVSLQEFSIELESLFAARFGRGGYRYNAQMGFFRLPSGDVVQLGYLDNQSDLIRWQGQSFDLIVFEEIGQMGDLGLVDLMLGCLRSAAGIPCRVLMCANPGGRGHSAIMRRFLKGRKPWTAQEDPESGRLFVICPSTLDDNPYLPAAYARQLGAVQRVDPGLYLAWRNGDWSAIAGQFFSGCWDAARSVVPALDKLPPYIQTRLSLDWGSARPAYCSFAAQVGRGGPLRIGDVMIGAGSWLLFDEICTATPGGDLNVGSNMPAETLGLEIAARCKEWEMPARGVIDCAAMVSESQDQTTIARLLGRGGVFVRPARKGRRVPRLAHLKELMANAGDPTRPGLYVAENCRYWLETVPLIARSKTQAEDCDSDGPDHGLDATSYLIEGEQGMQQGTWMSGTAPAGVVVMDEPRVVHAETYLAAVPAQPIVEIPRAAAVPGRKVADRLHVLAGRPVRTGRRRRTPRERPVGRVLRGLTRRRG